MTLKDCVFDDIDNVFLNADEFAEDCALQIGGKEIQAKIVRDDDALLERTDAAAQGTHLGESLIFIKASLLSGRPAVGARLTLNGDSSWFVRSCLSNMGMYEIRIGKNKT